MYLQIKSWERSHIYLLLTIKKWYSSQKVSSIVSVGALIGLLTTCFVNLLSQPRVFLSIADDGLYCKSLQKVNPKTKVPTTATILTGAGALLFSAIFSYAYLTAAISLACLFGYGSVCLGTMVKRYGQSAHKTLRTVLLIIFVISSILCGFSFTYEWPIICGIVTLGVCLAIMIMFKLIKPTWAPQTFSCPGLPWIPMIGAFTNFFMFGSAELVSWIIFGGFTLFGLIIYGTYGAWHSKMIDSTSDTKHTIDETLM